MQTNFGGSLTIAGVPVGRELGRYYLKDQIRKQEHGSCIIIVATDAPLDARRLKRLARRAPLGLAAAGSPISHGSGDYVLAFSTAEGLQTDYQSDGPHEKTELLRDEQLSPLFQAVRDATEEAVINSMLKAVTTTGHDGRTVEAIDPNAVVDVVRKYGIATTADEQTRPVETSHVESAARTYGQNSLPETLRAKIQQFEQQLPGLMKQHRVPGVSFALISNRRLAWSRGYGVRCAGSGELVQPDTIMEACSMSKPLFAYLVLKLVEQDRLDLDRPLVEYLGAEYVANDVRHRRITAQMALTHTSGLPNWRSGGWRSNSPLSIGFDPGTRFRYSGEGFLMLQRAVEAELNTDLDSFALEHLLNPLEMKNSRFVWDDRFVVRSSCGHDRDGRVKANRRYYDRANAAFTLYTTAEDYARFLVEIMREDRSAPHSISAESRMTMLTAAVHRDDKDADWGLGWGLRTLGDSQQVFHSGANGSGFPLLQRILSCGR